MTPFEASSLWAQWVGSVSALLAVVVATIVGKYTIANTARSKDAQQRSTIIAARDDPAAQPSIGADANREQHPALTVLRKGGERWLLTNEGPDTVYAVDIAGLTELDQRRLGDAPLRCDLDAGEAIEFVLVSRYTLSGPANIVVTYRSEPDGPPRRRVLLVPAP